MIRAYLALFLGIWLAATLSLGAGLVIMLGSALWAVYWSVRKYSQEMPHVQG